MNDDSSSERDNSDDSFPDEQSGNESFQLEKLEKYPADLPYDASSDAASADEAEPVSLSPTLVATIKEDLERSRIQRSRHDTLEDSIHRLRDQLQSEGDDASLSEESEVSDAQSDTDGSSGVDDVRSNPVFAEKPVMLPSTEDPLPLVDTPINLDLNELDSLQPSETQESDSSEGTTMPDVPEHEQRQSSRRLIYGLVGVLLLALLGGGAWWLTTHPGTQIGGAPPTIASHATADGANGEAEARVNKTQEGHETTTENQNAAKESHETAAASPHEGQKTPQNEQSKTQAETQAVTTPKQHDARSTVATGSETASRLKQEASSKEHGSSSMAQHSATAAHPVSTDKAQGSSSKAAQPGDAHNQDAKQSARTRAHDGGLTTQQPKTATVSTDKKTATLTNAAEKTSTTTLKSSPASTTTAKVNPPTKNDASTATKSIAAASPPTSQTTDKSGAAGSAGTSKNATSEMKHSTAFEPKMIAKPVVRNVPSSSKGVFTVQVYSTPNHEDADDWMRRLKTKKVEGGFVSKQNVRGTTYYRVRFGQYATRQEAESAAMSSGFQSSWVDRVK